MTAEQEPTSTPEGTCPTCLDAVRDADSKYDILHAYPGTHEQAIVARARQGHAKQRALGLTCEGDALGSTERGLQELVCGRYRAGSMMVTSNRPPTDWYTLFPNPVLAESALDRLVNSAHHIIFRGRTYRPLRRPDRGLNGGVEDADSPEEQQPVRPRQKRARETVSDGRNDHDATSDTSDDDASNAPTQRRT